MNSLQIDDFYEYKSGEVENVPLLSGTSYEAFFGGIPEDVDIMSGVTAHQGPFIGCLKDLVFLEEYVEWEQETTITGASLSQCSVESKVVEETTEAPKAAAPEQPETPEYDVKRIFPDFRFGTKEDRQGSCGLPTIPALDEDLDTNSGLRFGVKKDSFIEYIKKGLPEMMADQNRFQTDFKTSEPEGMIFFMGSQDGRTDFIALFIKGGKLVYSFNCGSGPSFLATDFRVDDGKWHSVEFSRFGMSSL